ncbi:hypothetical protein D3C71_2186400 [compost metagenome]
MRATVSAMTTIMPPSSADTGSTLPNDGPTSLRAICGAISPMKEMAPPAATEAPANATLIISSRKR